MNTVEKMMQQYVDAWNRQTLEDYKKEFTKIWAEDALYSDPYSYFEGIGKSC